MTGSVPADASAGSGRRPPKRVQFLVAIVVEGVAAVEVQALRRALGDRRLTRIAPHITLAPPTALPPATGAEVMVALYGAARRFDAMTLALGAPTTFAPAAPTVHLPVSDPTGSLAGLQAAVAVPPMRAERRPFAPHVTLCSGQPAERIAVACELLAGYTSSVWVSRLSLLERAPERTGWVTVDDVELDGIRVVGAGPLATELICGTVAGRAVSGLVELGAGSALAAPLSPAEPPEVAVLDGAALVITARRAGEAVGVAWGDATAGSRGLWGVAVDPAVRGEGIGTMLVREWQFRRRWRLGRRPALSR